ncbi:Lysophospholipid acyltransferase 5 [Portunus trituberculatus]|uniref:Lysophospholipid acyltransferase 5 n=1 Tax=Portunus trituberculatus TaxID=210409 RepID=A0A5B7DNX8_PORTR|nr:Lysophospholipid acyltransferase 5 [Portunus trituberculatus]
MAAAEDRTFLQAFANSLGAPEPALRLLISILIGYPLVLIHRYSLYCKNPHIQHLYFIASGVSIALFNYGYYMTGTDTYDIKWSMPHCVLTLRLIALTYDVYDGRKDPEKLSGDQQKTALSFTPTLIEIAGHTYFPASFMVGPQFSMRRYLDFVKGSTQFGHLIQSFNTNTNAWVAHNIFKIK